MTMEDLRQLPKTRDQIREELKKEIVTISADRQAAEAERAAAIEAEDHKKIIQTGAQLDIISRKISQLAKKWETPRVEYPTEEVIETWNEYAEKYNKTFDAKYKAYQKARRELAKQFEELVIMQRDGMRDLIAVKGMVTNTIGETINVLNFYGPLPGVTELKTIEDKTVDTAWFGKHANVDLVYFSENHDLNQIAYHAANQVVTFKVPDMA